MKNYEIEKIANSYNNDLDLVNKKLNSLASKKSRLAPKKGLKDYEERMREVLEEYEIMRQVKQLLDPKEKTTTQFTQEDVDKLDYEQTWKAKRSIQSKKTNTAWLTDTFGDNDEYRAAEQIEKMLNEHLKKVKPIDDAYIRKTDLQKVIDAMRMAGDLSTERAIEMLEELL